MRQRRRYRAYPSLLPVFVFILLSVFIFVVVVVFIFLVLGLDCVPFIGMLVVFRIFIAIVVVVVIIVEFVLPLLLANARQRVLLGTTRGGL
jgi:hypothetical protein